MTDFTGPRSRTRKEIVARLKVSVPTEDFPLENRAEVEALRRELFIGDCGLQPLEHRGPEVELGYDFHPRAWGRGLATEAASAVMEKAFGALQIESVVAVVKPENRASQRVLEKAGLQRTGAREAYGEAMFLYEAHAPINLPVGR